MADICIAYSHHDAQLVSEIYGLLSERWDVWWDDTIVGSFAVAIEREIPRAKCLLAIWSSTARDSDLVRDELDIAKEHDVRIIPVTIETCKAPYGFRGYSSVDLRGWTGDSNHPGIRQLLRKLERIVPTPTRPTRPTTIAEGRIRLPAFFPSISSFETRLRPLDAIRALRVFNSPTVLISAYDMLPDRRPRGIVKELKDFRANGGFVLMDSGNYEASRLLDERWKPHRLKPTLAGAPHDWAFCFDVMEPMKTPARAARQIIGAIERDQKVTRRPILPIIHAPVRKDGYDLDAVPEVLRLVAEELEPPMVAVPERELGPGLLSRARMVRRIREELGQLPYYQPLHLLGTGNPWSIAVLAAAGADSFDGLEWCRVLIDAETGKLSHFHNFDFFSYQAAVAASDVTVEALEDDDVDFAGKVAFHNLDYYAELSGKLQEASTKGTFEVLLTGLMGARNVEELRQGIPELFP